MNLLLQEQILSYKSRSHFKALPHIEDLTRIHASYRKNSKYRDMYVSANSLDSDQTALKEQSDQDLHCLPFFLHLLEALVHCKIKLF